MRKFTVSFLTILSLLFLVTVTGAQEFTGEWTCDYATYDDSDNGTGYNTIAVGVISENQFVAIQNRSSNNTHYIVGYNNADSANGRLGTYPYGSSGTADLQTRWVNGFDQVDMLDVNDVAIGPDGYIFVPNNDVERNILVFEMTEDTVISAPYRLKVDGEYNWAIDVDDDGRVYVSTINTEENQSTVKVYDNFDNEPFWSNSFGSDPVVMTEIVLPDTGEARGISVNSEGTVIFITNWDLQKIYKYAGDPVNGYVLDADFQFQTDEVHITLETEEEIPVGPFDVHYLEDNGLLVTAYDASFTSGSGYEYGRMYIANATTAEIMDTIDVANWNYVHNDSSYQSRASGPYFGRSSGYTSTYSVDFDENENLYSQSYYGWTVEKWSYSEDLPVITGIEQTNNLVPETISLQQNYPNPFNPSTKISFSLVENTNVKLAVYSITGELVTELIKNKEFSAGSWDVTFNAAGLASGTYIYRLTAGDTQLSKKMILIK